MKIQFDMTADEILHLAREIKALTDYYESCNDLLSVMLEQQMREVYEKIAAKAIKEQDCSFSLNKRQASGLLYALLEDYDLEMQSPYTKRLIRNIISIIDPKIMYSNKAETYNL
jgi:hypothetical protein